MWHKKVNAVIAAKYPQGFSLIEILISISLGAILLMVFASFSSSLFYTQTKQRELLNLQQKSHQLLSYMQQHIQHIGYQGRNRTQSNYSLFSIHGKSYQLVNSQCLVFFYDLNSDGCVGQRHKTLACELAGMNNTQNVNQEIFGFTLRNNHIHIFADNSYKNCYLDQCKNWATDCESNRWLNLASLSDYTVENLNFSWKIPETLLKIELRLKSVKQPDIQYYSTAYSYLLNSGE